MHLEMENPHSRAVHRPGNNNIEMKCMVYPMAKWTGNKGLTSFSLWDCNNVLKRRLKHSGEMNLGCYICNSAHQPPCSSLYPWGPKGGLNLFKNKTCRQGNVLTYDRDNMLMVMVWQAHLSNGTDFWTGKSHQIIENRTYVQT